METVYKHKAFNEQTLNLICDSELWFSSPKYFNDPFDGQLDLEMLMERFWSSQPPEIGRELKEDIFDYCYKNMHIFYGMGILSLNQNNSDIVVWSHYADEHRGLCFEFSLEGLREDYFSSPYNIDNEVDYRYSPIDVLNQLSFDDAGEVNHARLSAAILRALWECKHKSWKYENEIRFFSHEKSIYKGGKGVAKKFSSKNLVAIYYGIRTQATVKKCIHALLQSENYSHVKEYQMTRELGDFEIYCDENVDHHTDGDGW